MSNITKTTRLAANVADEAAAAAQGVDVATVTGHRAPPVAASDNVALNAEAKAEAVRTREEQQAGIQTGRVIDDPRTIDAAAARQAAAAATGAHEGTVGGRHVPDPARSDRIAAHEAAEGDERERAEAEGYGIKYGKVVPNP